MHVVTSGSIITIAIRIMTIAVDEVYSFAAQLASRQLALVIRNIPSTGFY